MAMFETAEDLRKTRIGIIGAGALGGFYGSLFARDGYDVAMLMRSATAAVRESGLSSFSIWGDWHTTPQVFDSAKEMGICGLLIVTLKTISNDALKEIFQYTVGPDTVVLTLQNGLGNEERILASLPDNAVPEAPCRVMGGCSFICSWREGDTVIRHTAGGAVQIAELKGPALPRTHALCEMFKACGVPCEVKDSPANIRWHKLVWNIPFNGLGLVAQADTAVVLEDPELLLTARGLMKEIQSVAACEGVTITNEFCAWQFERTMSMEHYKSSMQIDYEQGRCAEVESIMGEPVRRAAKFGVPVPLMTMLYTVARRLNQLRCGK